MKNAILILFTAVSILLSGVAQSGDNGSTFGEGFDEFYHFSAAINSTLMGDYTARGGKNVVVYAHFGHTANATYDALELDGSSAARFFHVPVKEGDFVKSLSCTNILTVLIGSGDPAWADVILILHDGDDVGIGTPAVEGTDYFQLGDTVRMNFPTSSNSLPGTVRFKNEINKRVSFDGFLNVGELESQRGDLGTSRYVQCKLHLYVKP